MGGAKSHAGPVRLLAGAPWAGTAQEMGPYPLRCLLHSCWELEEPQPWCLKGALDCSPDSLGPEEEEEALRDHRVKCLNNCAAAHLKLQQPKEALACCNEALRLDPDNVKALQRKGRVRCLGQGGRAEAGRGWLECSVCVGGKDAASG